MDNNKSGPVVELGGEQFTLVPKLPRFAITGLAAAQSSRSEARMSEAIWRLCKALIRREDWDRFEDLMNDDDDLFDELDEFISQALEGYQLGPTEESSDSAPSSNNIPNTSRVVSLERGTVEVQEADPSS